MKRVLLSSLIASCLITSAWAGPDLTSARIYRNQGDFAKAIQFYNLEIEKYPESSIAIYERGEVYGSVAMDRSKKGAQRDIAGESDDPQKSILEMMLADFDVVSNANDKKAKKKVKAIKKILNDYWTQFYNDAVAADKKHAEAIALIDSLIEIGDTLRTAEGADSLTPFDSISARRDAAEARTVRAVDIAMLLKPGEWNPLALKAQVIERAGRINEATEVWTDAKAAIEASDLSTENKEEYRKSWMIIQLHRLQNNYNTDQYERAIEVAQEIKEIEPENVDAVVFAAFSKTNMINKSELPDEELNPARQEALDLLKEARDLSPDDPAILFYLGRFSLDLGDTAAAIDWYMQYADMDQEDHEVLFQIGYLYLEGGSFKNKRKAEEVFQLLVNRFPDQCDAWINLGVAQINQDKTEIGAANITKGKDCKAASGE